MVPSSAVTTIVVKERHATDIGACLFPFTGQLLAFCLAVCEKITVKKFRTEILRV